MDRPSLHVCIATGQNLANLIPALQLNARRVVILETPDMRHSVPSLKGALESRGIEVERFPFDDTTPDSIVAAAERVALELGEVPLIFNATGGHKLMTLALADRMEMTEALHLLYCETRHDRLDWLKPAPATEPMRDVLTLDDVLRVQGFRATHRAERDAQWCSRVAARETLTRRLGDEAERLAKFFGALNKLADQALNEPSGPFRPLQELPFAPGGRNAEVLSEAQRHGLLNWNGDTELVFNSKEAAGYFRGGWLEEYAFLKIRGNRPADFAVDVSVETRDGKTPNQLDAMVVHRNRLLVVECKTARFGRDEGKDASYVYKLAQLSRSLGGIMSRSLLLSARPVSDETRQRARDNCVDLLAAEDVKKLAEYVRSWMAGSTT